MPTDSRIARVGVIALAVALGTAQLARQHLSAQKRVPRFELDAGWPKIPKGRMLGNISGLYVDKRNHVWISHRPGTVPALDWAALQHSECCLPLPPVSEFDAAGNFIQGFGPVTARQPKQNGVGGADDRPKDFDWPLMEHGMFIDDKDNVWLAGNGAGDNQVLKLTRQGKLVMQIGKPNQSKGNTDTRNLNQPTRVWVLPKTNEAFVSDGYVNRRIIVFDADTGAFKRMWGAYGNTPEDPPADLAPRFLFHDAEPGHRPRDDKGEGRGPEQFNIVHSIAISQDDLVYVADRTNNRVQVFTTGGKYVRETFIARNALGFGTALDVGFSPDAKQTYLYVADDTNGAVRILDRQSLELIGSFGQLGHQAGQLEHPHNLAVGPDGAIYTGDTIGMKVQRFVYKGM